MEIIPLPGADGFFTFHEAITLSTATPYHVLAVQPISNLIRRGLDAKKFVYDPYGLDEAEYRNAVTADTVIVTLEDPSHNTYYVPSTHITSFPNVEGVPYSYYVASIALNHLPHGIDLTGLKEAMEEAALKYVGIPGTARISTIGPPMMIAKANHNTYEDQRQAQVEVVETLAGKLLRTQKLLAEAEERANLLEEIILGGEVPAAP